MFNKNDEVDLYFINKIRQKIVFVAFVVMVFTLTSCGDTKSTFNDELPEKEDVKIAKEGSRIFGEDISLMTYYDVEEKLLEKNEQVLNESFDIIGNNDTYSIKYADIDYSISEKMTLDNIFNNDKDEVVYTYSDEKLSSMLDAIIKSESVNPKNATISVSGGVFDIKDGEKGLIVDTETLNNDIKKILDLDEKSINLKYIEKQPEYTRDVYNDFTLIGSYTTNYNVNATSRNQNLDQASKKINNALVFPNEVFSTNDHYGLTTVENGYAVASVIVGNELVDGVGGGVCQISSTLYNAVLRSELEIVERRNHSLSVSYVPLGFDATLANPYIDFKFRNNTQVPVLVNSYISNGKAVVNIYGKEIHPSNRTTSFRSVTTNVIEPKETEVLDNTLATGLREYDILPLNGLVVESYKDIYVDGKLTETVHLAKSTYTVRDAVVRVGTNDALVVKPTVEPTPKPVPTSTPTPESTPEPSKQPEATNPPSTPETSEKPIITQEPTTTPVSNDVDIVPEETNTEETPQV